MKAYVKILIALLLFSGIGIEVFGQEALEEKAPSLQVGLNGFSFSKGSLDAQLIMEIVAEKQEEIKLKAIQNVFLTKVQGAGGTIYSFTNNVVRELVQEKDQQVRTRKILENTVNLVFVTAYLEFYLNSLAVKTAEASNFLRLAEEKGYETSKITFPITLKSLITKTRERPTSIFTDEKAMDLIGLLLDMSSEAVRGNEKLKQLGLMQISYSATYEYLNKYKPDKLAADSVFKNMTDRLSGITDLIGFVNYLVEQYSYRHDFNSSIPKMHLRVNAEGSDSVEARLLKIKTNLDSLIKLLVSPNEASDELKMEINSLVKIYSFIDKAYARIKKGETEKAIKSDILYSIFAEFIPVLQNQSYRKSQYIGLIDDMFQVCSVLGNELLTNNKWIKEDEKINNFLLIASKLYQFNKIETISQYLKLIEEVGYMFPDDKVKNALSILVSFVKDYTVAYKDDQGKEVLEFNVESFLVKLQSIKPYKHSNWQFHLTVGLNNAYFNEPLMIDDAPLTNLSYVSEKIGVKFKFHDWAFYMPRSPGETYKYGRKAFIKTAPPKEPMISNVHWILYGSGLLYNLVNTKTNKEFNMPVIGTGPGVTFFNGLDLNFSIGVPIFSNQSFASSFDHPFFNLGFDIQFTEYYSRLKEKRNNKQTQKKLTEALKTR